MSVSTHWTQCDMATLIVKNMFLFQEYVFSNGTVLQSSTQNNIAGRSQTCIDNIFSNMNVMHSYVVETFLVIVSHYVTYLVTMRNLGRLT